MVIELTKLVQNEYYTYMSIVLRHVYLVNKKENQCKIIYPKLQSINYSTVLLYLNRINLFKEESIIHRIIYCYS